MKKLSETVIESLMKLIIVRLTAIAPENWTAENLQSVLNALLAETAKKPAELFSLIRISLTFAPFSPALNLTMETLGREVTLSRLNAVTRSL